MTDSNSLFDFYDCNSSNSFLKFEASSSSPLFELSPPSSSHGLNSPPLLSSSSFLSAASQQIASSNSNSILVVSDKMDSSINNPILTTASMPIPTRNVTSNSNMNSNHNNNNNSRTINDFSDVIFEFENSKSPISAVIHDNSKQQAIPMIINYTDNNTFMGQQSGSYHGSSTLMWEVNPMMNTIMDQSNSTTDINDKNGPFHMDEDDIFQVDKSDLIQGPTLAELNGDNLFVDLINIEDILTDSTQYQQQMINQNAQLTQLTAVNFPNLQHAIIESTAASQAEQLSPPNQYHTIAIPQTPNNTPIPSFQTSGGQIIFYDEPTINNSPYEIYSPPNTLSISTNLRNVASTPNQLSAFSPSSHSSTSTSSIVLNSSLSPPPPSSNTPTRATRVPRSGRSSGLVQHNPKYSTLKSLLTEKALLGNLQHASSPTQLLAHVTALSPSGLPTRRLNMQGGGIVSSSSSRLSSSAPTNCPLDQIWARREPRPHLLSTGSLAEGQGSTSSLSGEILSPENIDYSQDDNFSDDDSDHYEDFSSGK